MNKQMEQELKTKGFSIVNEDGIAYLHITRKFNEILITNNTLGDQMVKLMIQNSIGKIILH